MIKKIQIFVLALYILPVYSQSITPLQLTACKNDTIYVPFYTDSIPDYDSISGCQITFGYKHDMIRFVGVDRSNSIIPASNFSVKDTIYNESPDIEYQVIDIDNGHQTIKTSFPNQKVLLTLKFVAEETVSELSRGFYSAYTPEHVFIIDYRTIQTVLSFGGDIINIGDIELQADNRYHISATSGYNQYTWSYKKNYDTDYTFSDLTQDNMGVYYCGKGMYTVSATDANGCLISAEEYITIPEAIFARGNVLPNNNTEQTIVEAYIDQGGIYTLKAQVQIDPNGHFVFPGTLSPGNYIFKAKLNDSNIFESTWYGNTTKQDSAFVLKLNSCDGITGLDITLTEHTLPENNKGGKDNISLANVPAFKAYPNPATNVITIEQAGQLEQSSCLKSITISNLRGKTIYKSQLRDNFRHTMDISQWEKGMYFIQVGNEVIKILKK